MQELGAGTQIRRLTRSQDGNNVQPIWSHDGASVTFASDRGGTWGIWRQPADRSAEAEQLTTAEDGKQHLPESWSPDGAFLSFASTTLAPGANTMELWMLSVASGEAEIFYDLPDSNQEGSAFSPKGD